MPTTSPRRRREGAIYRKARIAFLAANPICSAHPILTGSVTNSRSVDVHHTRGRLAGAYLDETTWMAVCRECHDWIHQHPAKARQMGLLLK